MTQETNENFGGMIGVGGAVDFTAVDAAVPVVDPVQDQIAVCAPAPTAEPVSTPTIEPAPVCNIMPAPAGISVYLKNSEILHTDINEDDLLVDVEFNVSYGNNLGGVVKKRLAFSKTKLVTDFEATCQSTPIAVVEEVKTDKAGWYVLDKDGIAVEGPYNENTAKSKAKAKQVSVKCVTPNDLKKKIAENMSTQEKAAKAAQRARELAGIPHAKNWT